MKRLIKILLACVLTLVAVLPLVACNNTQEVEKGLYLKKTGDYYTAYKYVDDGKTTVLNIGDYNKDGITVGKIAEGTFAGNDTLVEVIVPDTVEEISAGAFKQMKKLARLTIPFVGKNANSDAYMYETGSSVNKAVDVERTFAYIFGTDSYDDSAYIYSNFGGEENTKYYVSPYLSEVTIKNSNEYSIPMCAFKNVGLISTINLLGNIDAIGEYAFYGCQALDIINIPDTVKTVYQYAFAECVNLTTIDTTAITEKVELKDNAFECCESLTNSGLDLEKFNYDDFKNVFKDSGVVDK